MNKQKIIKAIFIFIAQLLIIAGLSTQANALLIEFNSLQNYSAFSFEGIDANNDGLLVYDEVSRLSPFITNINQLGQNTYEYFGWGVFDINNAEFLNDTFSAWDIPTRPISYATEEEWVQYIYDSIWGPSSNYTIEKMSIRPEPAGVSRIVFDGINGVGFSQFYSANVISVPEPNILSLLIFGLIGLMLSNFLKKKNNLTIKMHSGTAKLARHFRCSGDFSR